MTGGTILMLVSHVDNLGFLQRGLQLSHQDLLMDLLMDIDVNNVGMEYGYTM